MHILIGYLLSVSSARRIRIVKLKYVRRVRRVRRMRRMRRMKTATIKLRKFYLSLEKSCF
jgi:hypothetical protein